MENEVWKDIADYEGLYKISNYGRIKTLERYYFSGMYNSIKKHQQEMIRKNEKNKKWIF